MDFEQVRKIALAMDGVEESTSYGTPAFKLKKKLIARLHQSEPALVVHMPLNERDVRIEAAPQTYYITDHYRDHPWVLVRLSAVEPDEMRALLTLASHTAVDYRRPPRRQPERRD